MLLFMNTKTPHLLERPIIYMKVDRVLHLNPTYGTCSICQAGPIIFAFLTCLFQPKMTPWSASAKNNHGNASGNGNRILSPTLNWKSNNKPEEVNAKGWLVRGAAAGAGFAVSLVAVNILKTWWWGSEAGAGKHQGELEDEEHVKSDKMRAMA
jgi:hypothetical protein